MHGQVLAGLAAAVIYSVLAGLSVPTQRTLVMLCIYFGLRWLRRTLDIGQSLSLALIAILLLDPFAPLAVGAWLSFIAVLVILMATSGRLVREGTIASFSRVQWAVTIGLIPVLLVAFGNLSLVAPVANVLAIPAFTLLIVPSTLVGTLAAMIHPSLGAPLLELPALLLDAGLAIVWNGWRSSRWRCGMRRSRLLPVLSRAGRGCAVADVAGDLAVATDGRIAVLADDVLSRADAGARHIRADGARCRAGVGCGRANAFAHVGLRHGPAYPSGRSAAELAVLPFLRNRDVRGIDLLMVSHGDQDHSGGLSELLAGMPVRAVLPPVRRLRARFRQNCLPSWPALAVGRRDVHASCIRKGSIPKRRRRDAAATTAPACC